MSATLDEARAAKSALAARLADHPAVNGIGIGREVEAGGTGEGFVVRIDLVEPAEGLPVVQDGVPVETRVVGRIVAR